MPYPSTRGGDRDARALRGGLRRRAARDEHGPTACSRPRSVGCAASCDRRRARRRELRAYIADIARATREERMLAARRITARDGRALPSRRAPPRLEGRDFVTPDDVKGTLRPRCSAIASRCRPSWRSKASHADDVPARPARPRSRAPSSGGHFGGPRRSFPRRP